jgi:hypothetical protein
MVRVCVIQTDNRPTLDYLLLSKEVNMRKCNKLGYNYLFIEMNDKIYDFAIKQYAKLYIVRDFLNNSNCDVLVFLDSDAWIQNALFLSEIIKILAKDATKNGCFSRDPYDKLNTFINSGSFIIKNNAYVKNMYNELIRIFESDLTNNYNDTALLRNENGGWCDQFYISNYVFKKKDDFNIFVPDILNCPTGKAIRHNWFKDERMYDDLNALLKDDETSNEQTTILTEDYDTDIFPVV